MFLFISEIRLSDQILKKVQFLTAPGTAPSGEVRSQGEGGQKKSEGESDGEYSHSPAYSNQS